MVSACSQSLGGNISVAKYQVDTSSYYKHNQTCLNDYHWPFLQSNNKERASIDPLKSTIKLLSHPNPCDAFAEISSPILITVMVEKEISKKKSEFVFYFVKIENIDCHHYDPANQFDHNNWIINFC